MLNMHTKREKDHLEHLGTDGGIMMMMMMMMIRIRILRKQDVDWIHQAQDADHWQALVNTVMNLWVSLTVQTS
jgi:hypothetical protein